MEFWLKLLTESPEFKLFDKISPIHDRTLEDKKYYRLTLPSTDIAVDGFELHEAHISIYEKIDSSNPTLGPSHFTAVFHDPDGQEFRMHLFLNRSDTLACSPTWERLDESHHYVKAEPPESMGYLTHLIWQQGLHCLQELRQQQKNLETRLIKDYEILDQHTSSRHPHLSNSRSAYLESLEKLIKSVKLLTQISNNSYWPRVVSYLGKSQKIMSSIPESRVEPIEKKQSQKQVESEKAVSITSSKQSNGKKNQHQAKTAFLNRLYFLNPPRILALRLQRYKTELIK